MTRTEWIDRLCNALEAFDERVLTTEQLAAITVTLETMMGIDARPQAAPVLTLVRGDAS
ncbi:hypothetical protein [Gordonia sp. SMJS1]|uniref:hypothetical protein n=1 Tax=Gordonia sp. SMJS1 TaxID=3039400 RepID=UPI0024572003|nr:hypothetical protein [Gordonia sp. SMJS1]WGJ86117.1 hypothetical protein QAD21_02670 [Gordonia sp. SMJS1]